QIQVELSKDNLVIPFGHRGLSVNADGSYGRGRAVSTGCAPGSSRGLRRGAEELAARREQRVDTLGLLDRGDGGNKVHPCRSPRSQSETSCRTGWTQADTPPGFQCGSERPFLPIRRRCASARKAFSISA